MSAKAFFDDHTDDNTRLLHTATNLFPEVYKRVYLANASKIAPIRTGALRKSIVTQTLGNKVSIGWRAPYAASVNAGQHTVARTRIIELSNNTWMFLQPGVHRHHTGSAGFLDRIISATTKDMVAEIRKLGLTK